MQVKLVDSKGEVKKLEIQDVKTSPRLVKELYIAYLSGIRTAKAKVKKRGEVRGGGRKPWRQKGTGRARIGSSRAPHWTGGGSVFGPLGVENYVKNYSAKTKKRAMHDAIMLKARNGQLVVLESMEKVAKTKEANAIIAKLDRERTKGTLVLLVTDMPQTELSAFRNLRNIKAVNQSALNIKDLVDADYVVLVGGSRKLLGETK